jgi:hypothetical protein
MKNIMLTLIALLCSVSSFATLYLVETGTSGDGTWTGTMLTATIVNLTTESKTLNEWFTATSFENGDEVWIAGGTYLLNAAIPYTRADGKVYHVYGGFDGTENAITDREKGIKPWVFTSETVLDGNNIDRVMLSSTLSGNGYYQGDAGNIWMIDGLTFTNGNANGNGGGFSSSGAITIRNCKFTNNTASTLGGGLHCSGQFSKVENCLFEDNSAGISGGGAYLNQDRIIGVYNSHFLNNSVTTGDGSGGGLYFKTTTANFGYIENCYIAGNSSNWFGGGLAIYAIHVQNCVIVNNAGLRSGSANYMNSIEILASSPTHFINCTIANNYGGFRMNGTPLFKNTIIWNNKNTLETAPTSVTFTNCAIYAKTHTNADYDFSTQPWTTAYTGCVTLNAENADAAGPNFSQPYDFQVNIEANSAISAADKTAIATASYKLTSGSPCINAGTSTGAPAKDFEGITRPQGSFVDIGAYEYDSVISFLKETNDFPYELYIKEGNIEVSGLNSVTNITVYNITGMLVKQIASEGSVSISLNKGVYLVRIGNSAMKVILK